jgi:RHS repeat-associated protein
MKRHSIIHILSCLLCLLFIDNKVWAGIDPPIQKELNGSLGQLKVDSSVLVEDAKFFSPAYYGRLIKPYPLKSVISLQINENALVRLQSAFTATVRVRISYVRNDSTNQTTEQDLTVTYDSTGAYNQKSVYVLNNASRVEVKVLSMTKTVAWDAFQALKIVNQLQSFPQYTFNCSTNAIQTIEDSALAPDTDKDELPVYWAPSIGADEYDLEWAYIDDSAMATGVYGTISNPNANTIFDNNATRVTITATAYRIPLIYDSKGYLFFRVRPVQWQSGGGRNEANWSSLYTGGLGWFEYNGHERSLNWQATTTYAEDGKRKTVIQYFDGSLRDRQTVTKDNSSNTTLVAESFYDYQGRAVIQVMPAPTLTNIIKYSRNFNVGFNSNIYDKYNYDTLASPDLYCSTGAAPMDSVSGASNYYSTLNPLKNTGIHRYIPNAGGYPFTETEYTQDNTGRISRVSGPGPTFRIGSGRETKYMYGSPDQRELDALFGTEVGHFSHYLKQITRDPNGQYSINYMDMHGHTIATALAGVPSPDIKVDLLPSNTSASRTENLSDPASTVIKDLVMETKKSLLVTTPDWHHFTYKLDTLSLQKEGCNTAKACYDCLYDLQITITDDCNNQKLGGAPFDTLIRNFSLNAIDTLCSNSPAGFSFSFNKFLVEGNYEITKKLSVSRSAIDYYRDSIFMKKNTCKTLEDFFREQRQLLAGIQQCKPTCQGCTDSVGTWAQFWTRFRTTTGIADVDTPAYKSMALEAYANALEDCRQLCQLQNEEDDIRKAMLLDMTPSSGQYANINNDEDVLSIFFSSMDGANPDTTALYRQVTNYLDADGNPDRVYDETSGQMVSPQDLSPELFVQKFKISWAEALLPFHPEYCKLQRFEMLNPSHAWDRRFEAVDTYAEALAKGYLNPIGEGTFPSRFFGTTGQIDRDPLGTLQSSTFYIKLRDSILLYRNIPSFGNVSMWGVASANVKCQTPNDNSTCYSTYGSTAHSFEEGTMCAGELDMAWREFRQMYLDIKKSIINKHWISLAACSTSITAAALVTAGHQPHFSDSRELQQASGGTFPNNQSEANAFQQQQSNVVNSYYASNCEAFASRWWQQLKPCNFSEADSAMVVSMLVEVCKEGADKDHPFGASTVRPGSTHRFKSFDEVLRYYSDVKRVVYNTNSCNVYLITDPPPYDRAKIYSEATIWKPEPCQCDLINAVYQKYQRNNAGHSTFVSYVNTRYSVNMTATELQNLLDMCNGTSTCQFLPNPITLPAPLQCGSEKACISCTEMAEVYAMFLGEYPNAHILEVDNQPSRDIYYKLFTNYFNSKLGFVKEYSEYETFLQQCNIPYYVPSTAGTTGGPLVERPVTDTASGNAANCDTLQNIVSAFNTLFPNLAPLNKATVRTKIISRPQLSYLLNCESNPNPRTVYPQLWRGSGLRTSGTNWYRNNLTFTRFNFWDVPHNAGTLDSVVLKMSPVLTEPFDTLMFWSVMTTVWDTTLLCNQLGVSFYGLPVAMKTPLYKYQSGQGNWVYNYNCRTLYNFFIRNPWAYLGDVLHSKMNPNIQATNNSTFIGDKHPLAQADPEASPRIEIMFKKDTLYQCRDLITAYFNYRLKSHLTYEALLALYQQKCGVPLPIACTPTNEILALCGRGGVVFPKVQLDTVDNCTDSTFFIVSKGTELYNAYVDSLQNNFDSSYRARCLEIYKNERFTVTHGVSEYHYALYYYDQAGNLVKTVPPEGVRANYDSLWLDSVATARRANQIKVPAHTLVSQYRYNTINTIVAQQFPDAGITEFWYDRLGRPTMSRNARQKAASATENNRLYSYTLYDVLGRVTEAGEIKNATTKAMHDSISRNSVSLNNWLIASAANKSQIVQTVYDLAYTGFSVTPAPVTQKNIRNKVAYTTFTSGTNAARYNQASFFSYDIHGNVDTLLQDYGSSSFSEVLNVMNANNNRFKKIAYQYDLISGKVNHIAYQAGQADQFYHRYAYDAENRLISAESSTDSIIWEKEARYEYYKHGPLARTVIGDQQVQGLDYAYTLQGWVKGINSTGLSVDYDMGMDGKISTLNQYVARDALGYTLNYFTGDYTAIGTGLTAFPGYSAALNSNYRPLYNGNISSMVISIAKFNNPLFFNYTYDQLNRLTAMDAWSGYSLANNNWNGMTQQQDYKERLSYDGNGNILKYLRNGNGSNLTMDSLTYNYNRDGQGRLVNNRLNYVRDRVNNSTGHSSNHTSDIEDQSAGNYSYDAIGNLTGDAQEGIAGISWNVYGKITEIQRTATEANPVTNIQYGYDATGSRISKRVQLNTGAVTVTWYVKDASGNILAVYNSTGTGTTYGSYSLVVQEQNIYGLSRVGLVTRNINVKTASTRPNPDNFVRGNKIYELSNHLQNVLVTISDKKMGRSSNGTTIDYYEADVVSAQDYAPFGSLLPGRQFGTKGRYLFNGKEQDPETKGTGNQYDYGFRIYDPRLGRFLSTDPLFQTYPFYTPYQFAGNKPIWAIDLDGLEEWVATFYSGDKRPTKFRFDPNLKPLGANQIYKQTTDLMTGKTKTEVYNVKCENAKNVAFVPSPALIIEDGKHETLGLVMSAYHQDEKFFRKLDQKSEVFVTMGVESLEDMAFQAATYAMENDASFKNSIIDFHGTQHFEERTDKQLHKLDIGTDKLQVDANGAPINYDDKTAQLFQLLGKFQATDSRVLLGACNANKCTEVVKKMSADMNATVYGHMSYSYSANLDNGAFYGGDLNWLMSKSDGNSENQGNYIQVMPNGNVSVINWVSFSVESSNAGTITAGAEEVKKRDKKKGP